MKEKDDRFKKGVNKYSGTSKEDVERGYAEHGSVYQRPYPNDHSMIKLSNQTWLSTVG